MRSEPLPPDAGSAEERIFTKRSYFAMWTGSCVLLGSFSVGSALAGGSPAAVLAAIVLACAATAAALTLCGLAGHEEGLSTSQQITRSFGPRASKVVEALRVLPAIIWLGFQTWLGGGALNLALSVLFGLDARFACYIVVLLAEGVLSRAGFRGVKTMRNIGALLTTAALCCVLYGGIRKFGLPESMSAGGWAAFDLRTFAGNVTICIGLYSAVILNASDYTRHLSRAVSPRTGFVVCLLGMAPATLLVCGIGWVSVGMAGVFDPIELIGAAIPNPALLVAVTVALLFAQLQTNLTNNLLPAIQAIRSMFGVAERHAVWIALLASVCCLPWKLVTADSARLLSIFIQVYSLMLGPVFAVLAVDACRFYKARIAPPGIPSGPRQRRAIVAALAGIAASAFFPNVGWFVGAALTAALYAPQRRG